MPERYVVAVFLSMVDHCHLNLPEQRPRVAALKPILKTCTWSVRMPLQMILYLEMVGMYFNLSLNWTTSFNIYIYIASISFENAKNFYDAQIPTVCAMSLA